MRRGTLSLLLFIVLLGAAAGYIVWPTNPGIHVLGINKNFQVNLGLDLQGGLRVLLKPTGYDKNMSPSTLEENVAAAETQIAQRVGGGLGVTESSIRLQKVDGLPGILVELPGFNSGDQNAAVNSLLKSGKLEFWSTGSTPVQVNQAFDLTQFTQYNPGGKAQFEGRTWMLARSL